MKFQKPPQGIDFPQSEEEVLKFWKEKRVFERSVEEKDPQNIWSFYDGPPFATGLPHHGHLLAGTIKDVIPRYWSMRGKRVERRFGWDCHGLPVEFEIEKQLNLKGRKEVLEYGVDKFNEACRGIVLRYTQEWRKIVERMGRWIDFDHDYKTMDLNFMESVWAVFKKLWDQGLIYEDKKSLPYSTRIATPLSNFEANLNYKDIQDPSITVKLELQDEPKTYFLIWTTTPWTLPSNLAVAVHPDFPYVKVEHKKTKEKFILHEKLVKAVLKKAGGEKAYSVIKKMTGKDLAGTRYKQTIPAFEGKIPENAFRVFLGDFVTEDSGTGLVHIAPGYGEDDFLLGKENGLPPFDHMDEDGVFTKDCPLFQGLYFKDADKKIIEYLKGKKSSFFHETIQHSYPFCYRSDTPLIYRAISTWFVNVTKIKDELIANNQKIHWVPEHLREGRFGKWLENARDWAISRNRFWGNPIPIWKDEENSEFLCVGSRKELEKLTGQKVNDLHKHFVDKLVIKSPKTGKLLQRIPYVLDCWFESGSMPYAQKHYPFSLSEEEFQKIFPADFIGEGLDQTRGWFYTLLVLSTALQKGPAFKNVVVNGIVLAEDGRKMSKRLKNYPDPLEIFENHGADALRIYLLQSGAVRGEDLRFSLKGLTEMTRKVLLPFWNAYFFLSTYAAVDGWDPKNDYTKERENDLDQWISIKLKRLKVEVHLEMEAYHLSKTVPPLLNFLDDLTNWYIRRSRRRFWKAKNDQDKFQAYSTLYEILVEFSKLVAPFMPFLSELIYSKLKLGHKLALKDSVHLDVYPEPSALTRLEKETEASMDLARTTVSLGRELREKLKIKTRQPLSKIFIGLAHSEEQKQLASKSDLIQEELNVREIKFLPFKGMAHWQIKPNFRVLGKKLGPQMKEFQKHCQNLSDEDVFGLLEGNTLSFENHRLDRNDFLIELSARKEFDHPCHSSGGMVVALDTVLTEDLQNEGLSRELINRVQRFRKACNLEVENRIDLSVKAPKEFTKAFESYRTLIQSETLSKLTLGDSLKNMQLQNEKLEGQNVTIGIRQTEA